MKILVPVDGSKHGSSAVAFIASRATLIGAQPKIELLNVQMAVPPHPARLAGRAIVQSYYKAEANRVLQPARLELRTAGLVAKTRYAVGTPGLTVGSIAAASDVDLIVMGSHGRTAFKGLLFGSVTQAVLASCKTPVLVIRGAPATRADSLKVGIAVDGSAYGTAAVRYVLQHRELWGEAPEFSLIHVLPDLSSLVIPAPAPVLAPKRARCLQAQAFDKAMGPLRRLFDKAGLRAGEVRLTSDDPGTEIASYATKHRVDILVMGSHGYGAFRAAVLGSVAARVAASCKTPLLLIRRR